jgi:hypothetical protein
MVEGKTNVEATIAELAKAFPAAFTLDSSLVGSYPFAEAQVSDPIRGLEFWWLGLLTTN